MKGEDDSEVRRKAFAQKHEPQPQDIDIEEEGFDFSKWLIRRKRRDAARMDAFYTILARDGTKFNVNLPDGSIHRVSVIWIE